MEPHHFQDSLGCHRAPCPRSGRLHTTGREGNRSSRNGAPIDVTLRCALTANGEGHPNAAAEDGAVLTRATVDRVQVSSGGGGTGGRWSNEPTQFINDLAAALSREAPPVIRRSVFLAWKKKWSRMIGISCGRAFASSLAAVANAPHTLAGVDGETFRLG